MRGFRRLVERYGQTVEVRRKGEAAGVTAKAFLQPVLERREGWVQREPTALGLARRDKFLYLGPPENEIDGRTVVWRGTSFGVRAAQRVYVGDRFSHQWAVLTAE